MRRRWAWLCDVWSWFAARWLSSHRRVLKSTFVPTVKVMRHRRSPKPPWVRRELIRLRAWSPDLGCRKLAEVFNRQFAARGIPVSKSHVADVLRKATADIARLRRDIKHRVPRPMPTHRVWAMDLTGKADRSGRQQVMLGLLDHGSRACLRLAALNDKRSITILCELIGAFKRFGLPQRLRVDNEACFNSRLMKAVLALLGIRLQTTELHCPWQNGRIERFFGTFKERLERIAIADVDDLRVKLMEFRAWYNHARTHQHLGGQTPAEVWDGRPKSAKRPRFVSVWGGHLTGWWFPP